MLTDFDNSFIIGNNNKLFDEVIAKIRQHVF